jgi:FG-GAP-like repeat
LGPAEIKPNDMSLDGHKEYSWVLSVGWIILVCSACHSERKNHSYSEVPASNIEKGRNLANTYCQSCHLLPEPALADVATWYNGILPQMGPRLGIFRYGHQNYPSRRFDKNLPKGFYPEHAQISDAEWQYIIDYYCSNAPDSLPGQDRKVPIAKQLPFFEVSGPKPQNTLPATVMVKIGQQVRGTEFLVSDAVRRQIRCYDGQLRLTDSVSTSGPVVSQDTLSDRRWVLCDIGVMDPNDGQHGKLVSMSFDRDGKAGGEKVLYDSLRRPVQLLEADLNGDGRKDILVCEFGNLLGALSWYEQREDGHYDRHLLLGQPGAIRAEINDYNHDGRPDIWCLFAQGDECIRLFTNRGRGEFQSEQVLRFPPIFGSSSFELDDFNHDGYPDILYTCGDNADFSTILKPYHGVYIFLNDHTNHFQQKYFFPINGCYKAMARDFDGDGDLDIATIAYFADFVKQPEESFVYLENDGNFIFKPYSFPQAVNGRWLTMDVGDLDEDGREDIILGNLSLAPSFLSVHADWKKGPSFLVLKNKFPRK